MTLSAAEQYIFSGLFSKRSVKYLAVTSRCRFVLLTSCLHHACLYSVNLANNSPTKCSREIHRRWVSVVSIINTKRVKDNTCNAGVEGLTMGV